ncbi:radical SAM protein [Nocardia sp. SYP-A9097]|uniref:radical SAM/SPASM domain-containing protein n=1 Tax=Nocardia sp. SYP-A9097 TaxID=2663237 RepID=UPI00129A3806|nr:radical SAM/SPASM domain-containing protein [Nocardia sp. SYP-A9097]MRH92933.1 radical SAM protein [Nocardia sp. SYP-A9097]
MAPLVSSLQTSPYLTRVDPGAAASVLYLTDTFGPTFPHSETPTDKAVFGILGLDRRIDWHADPRMLDLLIASAREPQDRTDLAQRFGSELVAEAAARQWVQAPVDLCRDYRLVSGEIEVTAHCNWSCRFCPVSTDPKPRQTMPMSLFGEVIAKLAAHGSIDYVTFQFFNEPTLDRYFSDRLTVLAEHGLELALYTNASALTAAKIEALCERKVLRHLIVNLPSVDPERFAALTGSRSYEATTRNLRAAIDAGFRIQIVVNGIGEQLAQNVEQIGRRYLPLGVQVTASATCDRAGDVDGEYFQNVQARGRLTGCGWPVHHANISVTGDLFLCCNDYYQRERFGNIRDGSLHDLMSSDAAVLLRQKVFGVTESAVDFLCRRCHNQALDYPGREFRPIATFG